MVHTYKCLLAKDNKPYNNTYTSQILLQSNIVRKRKSINKNWVNFVIKRKPKLMMKKVYGKD